MGDGSPTRVALVTSSYAPYVGGVETHVSRLAHVLGETGHVVEVWSIARDGAAYEVVEEGRVVRHLPAPLPARSVGAMARFGVEAPRAWRAWRSALTDFRPALLHVHCFGPNGVYANSLAARYHVPLIVTSHGETAGDDENIFDESALLRRSLRQSLSRASAVTAPTDYVLRDLRDRFGLRGGSTVPNGIEALHRADASIVVGGARPAGRYLFAVGRLGAMKGFDLLVEAFAEAELPADVRLVIGGDGPERSRLENLARLRAGSRVEFAGWMQPAQVAQAMASSLAVVVPSRSEAFGIVALEAWRAGTALVMTSRGGASEFMTDGYDALLVDPLDGAALASVLRRTLDPATRDSLAAHGHSRIGEFSWERVAAMYSVLYESALIASR